MYDSINRRLDALESRLAAHRPPSFEEFESKWAGMSELDHAAYEGAALGDDTVVRGYLTRMGVLTGRGKTLREIAAELDNMD